MKFFIPYARSPEEAESIYTAIRGYLETLGMPTTERRLARLAWVDEGGPRDFYVGDVPPGVGEPIIALFEGAGVPKAFYICTANRGAARNDPFEVVADDRTRSWDFEPDTL